MSAEYPQVLFWKWDDSHVELKNYKEKIKDICSRSCFDYIYVGTAWCQKGLLDSNVRACVEDAVAYTHELKKKFVFEIDVRPVRTVFTQKYPEGNTALMLQDEVEIDNEGKACLTLPISDCHDQFGKFDPIAVDLFRIYALDKTGAFEYAAGSAKDITASAKIETRCGAANVTINANGCENKTAVVMVNVWYDLPDSASDFTIKFFDEVFDYYKDIPLDGAAIDEWGYIAHPNYDFKQSYKKPWYSKAIAKQIGNSFNMEAGLFYLQLCYAQQGNEACRIKCINHYHELIRNNTLKIENYYYKKVKETFGKDAFVGVHPTWYAIREVDNSPEIYKNGINWWDVPRDYGFTDEIMLLPVRSALAHKWKSNVWYNMWYGEGTGDKQTFAREIWQNARYGGRVITLGYEVLMEKSCAKLFAQGDLEYVDAMERKIRMLNAFQTSPLDCRVLVVMGIPASCNWLECTTPGGDLDNYNSDFVESFTVARDIWNAGWNCDLVASYEIDDEDLKFNGDGKPVYGSQVYDCVVFAFPQYAKRTTIDFLKAACSKNVKSIVIGKCDYNFDGCNISNVFDEIKTNCNLYFEERPEIGDIIYYLRKWNIKENRVPYGSVLQDGSIIITNTGIRKPVGNEIKLEFDYEGNTISAAFEDLLALKIDSGGYVEKLAAPSLSFLKINGNEIVADNVPSEILKL